MEPGRFETPGAQLFWSGRGFLRGCWTRQPQGGVSKHHEHHPLKEDAGRVPVVIRHQGGQVLGNPDQGYYPNFQNIAAIDTGLGRLIPGVERYFLPIVLLIVFVSILPGVFEWYKNKK